MQLAKAPILGCCTTTVWPSTEMLQPSDAIGELLVAFKVNITWGLPR
jgi:hypothetical protein